MPVTTAGDQEWESVGAEGVEVRLGPEPDTTDGFPARWRVFGPLAPDSTRIDEDRKAAINVSPAQPLVTADIAALTQIPEELIIGSATFKGKNVRLKEGDTVDFSSIFKIRDKLPGYQAYAIAEFTVKQPTKVIVGTGCDWWMQLWIDGEERINTLHTGNRVLKIAPSNHCWAYYPRWGQNWRARAFYAVIGISEGHGHIRGLRMMLMPNVVTHWNAMLNMKVKRRGSHIQMYVNGVKGPFVVDDTYGPGRAGLAGFGKCRVQNLKIDGARNPSPA